MLYTLSPTKRLSIRHDFPCVERFDGSPESCRQLASTIRAQLVKLGEKSENIEQINIIYPQSMPDSLYPKSGPKLRLQNYVEMVRQAMEDAMPNVRFVPANDIFRFASKKRADAVEGRTTPAFDIQPRFVSKKAFQTGDKRKYYIAADETYDNGGTLAAMESFIEGHGGHILAAPHYRIVKASGNAVVPIVPTQDIVQQFDKTFDPDQKEKLISVLDKLNLSIPALTHQEMQYLCSEARDWNRGYRVTPRSFRRLLANLEGVAEQYTVPVLTLEQERYITHSHDGCLKPTWVERHHNENHSRNQGGPEGDISI